MGLNGNHEQFIRTLIMRGLGIYGYKKMAEICEESGIALLPNGEFEVISDAPTDKILHDIILNYSKFNLAAKMTAMLLAKRHNVPIPPDLTKKKRLSRIRRLFKRS